jgi:putative tryptophan/tyrosine transport system substrate-binding protein
MTYRTLGLLVILALGLPFTPLTTAAQPPAHVPRIGYLSPGPRGFSLPIAALQRGLRELHYVEGQNIAFEYRFAEGKPEEPPELAAELVRLKVDVIVAYGTQATLAAKHATTTIPIVMTSVTNPVQSGLVDSLARPGGNITGSTSLAEDLSGKRLELLKEAVPQLARVAVLWCCAPPRTANDNAMARRVTQVEVAAQTLGVTVHSVGVRDANELERALATVTQQRPDALLVVLDTFIFVQRSHILDFAATNRLPAMYEVRDFVDEGGLMTYGPSFIDRYGRIATYVDKILRGAKPADLPMEAPMAFELVINLKTAQALGLTIPPTLLFQATEVIR